MLGYVTIGVKDLEKSEAFYTELLSLVGAKSVFGNERIKFFGTGMDKAMLAICIPYNEEEQHCGNGTMVAIPADEDGIKALYDKAIELGATCDGEPGQRAPFFYGAYVRDFDGNKLCFFKMSM